MPLMNSQYFIDRYCERYDARVRRPDVAFALVKLAHRITENIHEGLDPQPGF